MAIKPPLIARGYVSYICFNMYSMIVKSHFKYEGSGLNGKWPRGERACLNTYLSTRPAIDFQCHIFSLDYGNVLFSRSRRVGKPSPDWFNLSLRPTRAWHCGEGNAGKKKWYYQLVYTSLATIVTIIDTMSKMRRVEMACTECRRRKLKVRISYQNRKTVADILH